MKTLSKFLLVLALGAVICLPGSVLAYTTHVYSGNTLPGLPTYDIDGNFVYTSIVESGPVTTVDVVRVGLERVEVTGTGNAIIPGAIGLMDGLGNIVDQLIFGNVYDSVTNKTYGTLTLRSLGYFDPSITSYALTFQEHPLVVPFGDLYVAMSTSGLNAYRPENYLISTIPLPASVVLLGTGLLGLVGLGWRRRKES